MNLVGDVELTENADKWKLECLVQSVGSNEGLAFTRITAKGQMRPFTVLSIETRMVIDDDYWENRVETKLREAMSYQDD